MPGQSSGDWLLMVDGAVPGNPGLRLRRLFCTRRKKLCRYFGTTINVADGSQGIFFGLK